MVLRWLPTNLRALLRDLKWWRRSQGLSCSIWNRLVARRLPGRYIRIYLRGVRGPVYLRKRSSDWDVFRQVVGDCEYAPILDQLGTVKWFVDGGANIGLATIEVKRRCPDARIVAVEPVGENYELLRRNLARYGSAVSTKQAAIWNSACGVELDLETFRDGREWSATVRESHSSSLSANAIQALTLDTLLAEHNICRVDLLKLDIEGAETKVFEDANPAWRDRVDCLAVELHPDSKFGDPTNAFATVFRGAEWLHSKAGELHVVVRTRRISPAVAL
jgi:FkbM family methyltransferase